jgi:predicted ABC-type ATPase
VAPEAPGDIYVLGGTNGAGKSSVGGAAFRAEGSTYYNPDEAARRIRELDPGLCQADANARAWTEGCRLLERAIATRQTFAFEATLGGDTITGLLERAAKSGVPVRIWYAGLATPDLHIERVKARVRKGGHDIPEATIRRRFHAGRLNLIRLLPDLAELRVFDNSADADPSTGAVPRPLLLLHLVDRSIVALADLDGMPEWAKPIVATAWSVARTPIG